jgi:hypothetical protein
MRFFKGAALAVAVLGVASAAHAVPEKKLEPTFKNLGHVHGYFVNEAGEGLSGVVALKTPSGRILSLHHTYAQQKGRFDIDNLAPGRYKLGVESCGTNIVGLEPPSDVEVEVVSKKVARPHLVAH